MSGQRTMQNSLGEAPVWKEHCQADRAFVSVNILLHPWAAGAWEGEHRQQSESLSQTAIRKSLLSTCNTWAGKFLIHLVFVGNLGWREGAKMRERPLLPATMGWSAANWTSLQGKSLEDELSTGNVWVRTIKAARAQGLTRFVMCCHVPLISYTGRRDGVRSCALGTQDLHMLDTHSSSELHLRPQRISFLISEIKGKRVPICLMRPG